MYLYTTMGLKKVLCDRFYMFLAPRQINQCICMGDLYNSIPLLANKKVMLAKTLFLFSIG